MIARVTLELSLRKEFDYLVPPEWVAQIEVGSRVKVPFQKREMLGFVTALVEESPHTNLRPILQVIGSQALITPKILRLAHWLAGYYCCSLDLALRSALPEPVRKEEKGWRERLVVRVLHPPESTRKLSPRQKEVWNRVEAAGEMALQELLHIEKTTSGTVRRMEEAGWVAIGRQISERDPYNLDHFLPSEPLALNPEQKAAW